MHIHVCTRIQEHTYTSCIHTFTHIHTQPHTKVRSQRPQCVCFLVGFGFSHPTLWWEEPRCAALAWAQDPSCAVFSCIITMAPQMLREEPEGEEHLVTLKLLSWSHAYQFIRSNTRTITVFHAEDTVFHAEDSVYQWASRMDGSLPQEFCSPS